MAFTSSACRPVKNVSVWPLSYEDLEQEGEYYLEEGNVGPDDAGEEELGGEEE